MLIGGFQKFTLIDFPGKMAALIFTQGCPFMCHYCHNPNLVLKEMFAEPINEDIVLEFLKKRKNQLDGVVISGGEPTLQKDLIEFIKKLKNLNYGVKLDTNGTNPNVINKLLDDKLIEYIAMDIKAPLEKYKKVTQREIDINLISESIKLILSSKIAYEFRTTLVEGLHELEDIKKMAQLIKGAKLYILQKFVSKTTLNPEFKHKMSFSDESMEKMKHLPAQHVKKCLIR